MKHVIFSYFSEVLIAGFFNIKPPVFWNMSFYTYIFEYIFVTKDVESYKVIFLPLIRWSRDSFVLCSVGKVNYAYWFYTLKNPCASENNYIWLWYMMSFIHYWIFLLVFYLKKYLSIQHRCCPVVSILLYFSLVLTPVIMTSSSNNNVMKVHDLIKWPSFRRSLLLFYYYVGIWLFVDFFCPRASNIRIFFDKIFFNLLLKFNNYYWYV